MKMKLFLVLACVGSPLIAEADDVNFNRDVRPILSESCFACHGFDAKQRKADLRLDVAEGAFAERDGFFAVKPGDLKNSEVWQRIISDDPNAVMPPPSTKKTLTAAQRETIRKWIEQGAPYQKHWAFEPPVKSPEPVVKRKDWARNFVDPFLLSRLEKERLAPSPEADRNTLIRRVAFALTGLPPTIDEASQFLADDAPEAYERMVDRYLSSPRYGEEMARHWLDVARYADTHGLHLDNERTMWAYRDWVVKSFNENQPFDEFTIDQLAGDLLPNPTPDQLTATGFNRCNVTTSEGGSIEAEFLYRYAVDRTSTMVQAWMGLTGGCAVCHDHKYDPLTTREFYSMYSFFYSAADPAMDRNTNATDPFYRIATDEQNATLARLRTQEAEAKRQLEDAVAKLSYQDPAAESSKTPEQAEPEMARLSVEDVWLDDVFPAGSTVRCSSRNDSIWDFSPDVAPPLGRRALRQASAANYQDKFENPRRPLVVPDKAKLSIWSRTDVDARPLTLLVEVTTGRGTRKLVWGESRYGIDQNNSNWMGELPESGKWIQLELPNDKLDLKPGDQIKSVALAQFGGIAWWDGMTITGEINPATDPRLSFTVWWAERTGKDTPATPSDLAALLKAGPNADPAPTTEQREKLLRFYLAEIARPINDNIRELQQALESATSAKVTLEESLPGTFIFKNIDKPREAFVMMRGEYDNPGEKVEPGVPAIFPPLTTANPDGRANRLDLARWIVSPEHPLAARVAVNRVWQQLFGIGLVKTSYDFGSQGEVPSHPELLDQLAVWYRDNGWDTKALVRLLVTSAAFRQDSTVTPELLRDDPDNRLLARGPRFRLDAEQIRDNALFVGDLINLKMGGRGVNSYQPPNIWEPVGYGDSNTRYYLQDHGSALYRRSLYLFLKRTAPPPFMSNFDAPNREQFCTLRERSNTPLQALQLLNDTQHFEAARGLAERILKEGGATPDERISFVFQTVLSRKPQSEELDVVKSALAQFLSRYQQDAVAAKNVITVGESTPNPDFPESELAAYTLLSNLILNLDETVMRN